MTVQQSWASLPFDQGYDKDAYKLKSFLSHPVELCLKHIEYFEGFRAKAYKCPAGVWTIGYGHTLGVQEGDTVDSHHEAEALLVKDVEYVVDRLSRYINVPVSAYQFVALVSLAFNVGVTYMTTKCPKLMRALNTRHYDDCAYEFLDITSGGLPGLVKRRKAESELMMMYEGANDE